jgi:hypothetical protein
MADVVNVLASALLLSFFVSCVSSGVLQVIAWSRHAREGVVPSLRALWRPDGHLDAVGVRQIRVARSLLILGVVAYLSYGILLAVAGMVSR